jgi:hypothetical protein
MRIISILIVAVLLFTFTISCSEQKEEVSEKMEMKADKQMSEHSIGEAKSELVREGVIDVASIDINNDGKIYECPMDWNVLADEYHDCPVCGMKMKEYTLSEVKDNLVKYGHKVKE